MHTSLNMADKEYFLSIENIFEMKKAYKIFICQILRRYVYIYISAHPQR